MSDIDALVTALSGKLTREDLNDLNAKLDALQKVKTQEDFDEGARLHREKNAPWISGPYTHLGPAVLNPPYTFKMYPKAVYHPDYNDARKAVNDAYGMPAYGSDEAERKKAIYLAEKWLEQTTKKVNNEAEHNLVRGTWFDTPTEAQAAKVDAQRETAVQAAHLAYEDRHLGDVAKREREEADELADDHLVDVTQTLKAKKRKPALITSA